MKPSLSSVSSLSEAHPTSPSSVDTVVAIDLGSNSFHMVVASVHWDADNANWFFRWIDRRSEKVRLALGLDEQGNLEPYVQDRALECLERFAQRIAPIPSKAVRVLGTNTLRVARDGEVFIARAEAILQHPINVIDGREEARLIYLGVAHANETEQQRLVIDIGGGSTEVVIGKKFSMIEAESLPMGCVSFNKRFFPDGTCDKKSIQQAIKAARQEALEIHKAYKNIGWDMSIGASGSIKAIYRVVRHQFRTSIDLDKLEWLCEHVAHVGDFDSLELRGLSEQRKVTFVAGLCVLTGLFMQLNIQTMELSDSALREGALYDLMGRLQHNDIREKTIDMLIESTRINREHAQVVLSSVTKMVKGLALTKRHKNVLRYSVLTHEWGLVVSHNKYHAHGAYLLKHTDLTGFSRKDKREMAFLVGNQRKKIDKLELEQHANLLWVLVAFRLSVILHRDRKDHAIDVAFSVVSDDAAVLTLSQDWFDERPLTQADLEQEINQLAYLDVALSVECY